MPDDRPALLPEEAIAELQRQLADLQGTINARLIRRSVGDIEPTIRTTAKADTLLLQGQTVSRADYQQLWDWVVANGLNPSVFGNGDGSTTFTLPDLRNRTVVGAGASAVGSKIGADTIQLTTAQLPSHRHNVSVATHGNHDHDMTGGSVPSGGSHGGHRQGDHATNAGSGNAFHITDSYLTTGSHGHGTIAVFSLGASAGSHSVTESSVGSGSSIDIRQASYVINWLIWV